MADVTLVRFDQPLLLLLRLAEVLDDQPHGGGVDLDLPAGVPGQAGQQALGQAAARLAVGGGVGGASGQAPGGAPGEEAGDGGAAGTVGVKDLGEEDPQGDQGGEQAVVEGDRLLGQGLLDLRGRQEVGKGQAGGLGEVGAQAAGWAAAACGVA